MKNSYLRNVINEGYLKPKISGPKRYIMIDLYSGRAESVPQEDIDEAIYGLRRVKGKDGMITYKGEEYIVVVL